MTIPRLIWTEEAIEAWKAMQKKDDCCYKQLGDYAQKEYPTPTWAPLEVERAFYLGFMVAKGQIKL